MSCKSLILPVCTVLVGTVSLLNAATAQAQIAITGGQIGFVEVGGTMQLGANASVTGTLATGQGTINTPAITLTGTNTTQAFNPFTTASQTFNLVAAGTAYTPNGPVVFANVPVTVQWTPTTSSTVFQGNTVTWQNQPVTGGQFGTGNSITTNSGVTSLAANNFNFDSTFVFPAPVVQPPVNPSPTPVVQPPTNPSPTPIVQPPSNTPSSPIGQQPADSGSPSTGNNRPTPQALSSQSLSNLETTLAEVDQSTFTNNEGQTYRILQPALQPTPRQDGIYSRIFPASGLYQ